MLLADFVRRADRRGTSERTSGGKAVTGATGSICHHRVSVKRIFSFFLGQQPRFSRFPPVFRLFLRTGETTKLPFLRNLQSHFRRHSREPANGKFLPLPKMKLRRHSNLVSSQHIVDLVDSRTFGSPPLRVSLRSTRLCVRLSLRLSSHTSAVTPALRRSTLVC
jgi:hypothetical protein